MRFANHLTGVCIAVALAASAPASAQTAQKKPAGILAPGGTTLAPGETFRAVPKTPAKIPKATTLAPLTKGECEKLGGKVQDNDICKSGKTCSRRDEDGRMRAVCITAR